MASGSTAISISTLSRLVLVALISAACSGGAAQTAKPAAAAIRVAGDDTMRFMPNEIRVKAGQPATVEFVNQGQILHDLVTKNQAVDVAVASPPGTSRSGAFTPAGPGRYEFFCGQAGHEQAGMKGTIVVE